MLCGGATFLIAMMSYMYHYARLVGDLLCCFHDRTGAQVRYLPALTLCNYALACNTIVLSRLQGHGDDYNMSDSRVKPAIGATTDDVHSTTVAAC
jgi:hypothetical protein